MPVVIIIAILTLVVYLLTGQEFGVAITTFITILVVACPCSLGLATPLAIIVAEGLCANKGILVKKSEILENAQKVDTIIFDKTGTLTYGKLKISTIKNYSNLENRELLQIVGSVETKSTHPIAEAFVDYLTENKIEILSINDFENIAGVGIKANIENDEILLGNEKILLKYQIKNNYKEDEEEIASDGNSIVYVVKNKEIIAIIGINDIIREGARDVISTLNKNKIQTIMLTGDNKKTAEKIAKDIGITKVISNVLPNEKAKIIRELREEGKYVLMCGDGINDSPALAIADIGVSVNSGADIAIDSSDVILIQNELKSIINLINISKKTIKNVKQNLFWAFFYNLLMIPIAIGVFKNIGIEINPMIASGAMVFSSITVICNSLRLRKIK